MAETTGDLPALPAAPEIAKHTSKGIDIRDAVSILSSRAETGGDRALLEGTETVTDDHRSMGQTIELHAEGGDGKRGAGGCGCSRAAEIKMVNSGASSNELLSPPPNLVEETEEERRKAIEKQRERRLAEIRRRFDEMDVRNLLRSLFEVQRERTAAYREFDG